MMLSLDTAYRSFGGEGEASSTPTIFRLPDSRRHQLSAIARRCGLSANMMVADRTVHIRAQDAEGCIWIVKNLNDGQPAIGEAEIILTRSLKQFRLDKIEVCCGLQKSVPAMMLQGCRKADRAEVVERDRFATPNSLKSHGERNLLSPFSNPCAITPKLCMLSSPIHPSKNYPALKSTYRG